MATEVDGQTLDVPVGALIDLAVKYRTGWGVLQKVEWEIPGTSKVNYVADYTNDNSTAAVTEVSTADKQKIFEGNARKVYSRLGKRLEAKG